MVGAALLRDGPACVSCASGEEASFAVRSIPASPPREGLEQSFNSLHAQREACEAYIRSQMHEGWSIIRKAYDDGGFSGGTMERPALTALLADIRDGQVDVVVVYKIDRLTRSLFDFAKIVEIFDAASVSFVSVTQSFNTTTSMGRLTLNVLLSFAQFEREVTGERIRDKIAASKRKGMWMGGNVPFGYRLENRRLVMDDAEAQTVRTIFRAYARLGTVRLLKAELDRSGLRARFRTIRRADRDGTTTTGGLPFGSGHLYAILRNPIYIGRIRHRHESHEGEHQPIIPMELWDRVQAGLDSNSKERISGAGAKSPSLLTGIIFDHLGRRLTPSHSVKGPKRYRYYCTTATADEAGSALRLPATDLEDAAVGAIGSWLANHGRLTASLLETGEAPDELALVLERATALAGRFNDQNPGDRHDLVRSLVHRVEVGPDSLRMQIAWRSLSDLLGVSEESPDAAEATSILIETAISIERRGKEQRLVITSAAAGPDRQPNVVLVSAIVRARRWFAALREQKVSSVADLGRSENSARAWISHQLSLAFLAPDLIEAVLEGSHPPALTLERLIEIAASSSCWAEQRQAFRAT
jgi:site-specific DNA recombinase